MTPATARKSYIVPALKNLDRYSRNAECLLMGTAAIESNFQNFEQFGGGPARGLFQMEQATFDDIAGRYLTLPGHGTLRQAVFSMSKNTTPLFVELIDNHLLAAALARVKYSMCAAPIPAMLEGQANYWWVRYNGRSLNGLKPTDYLARWKSYCAPLFQEFR